MARLRWINVWPPMGFPDRPWLDHHDDDTFARSSRGVCELYTEAVVPAKLEARYSELRLFCQHEAERDDVLVEVEAGRGATFDFAFVALPSGIAELPASTRSMLALDVVHAAASRLGQERGWDQTVLDAARQHALDRGLRFRWAGRSSAPNHALTAQPVFVMHDDGYGRVTVEIRERDGNSLVAVSEPALAFSTSAGFARSAATLCWYGSRSVQIAPYDGLSAETDKNTVWGADKGY